MKNVSVIVPVYNSEKFLDRCIKSIIKEEYLEEVILIDDGSLDNSKKIIDKYTRKYNFVKYFYQKNMGPGAARNNGIKKAKGKYFMFVDSDDFIENGTIKKSYELMENEDLDILYWNINWIIDGKIKKQPIFSKVCEKDSIEGYLLSDPSPCNKMFKNKIFKDNNVYFPDIYYEDFALIPGLIKYTNKIKYTSQITYNYFQNNTSIMHQNSYNEKSMDLLKAFKFLKNNLQPLYKNELEYLAINQLLYFRTFELLKYNRNAEIKTINKFISENYPNWQNNIYYLKRSKLIRLYCLLISKNRLFLANLLCKIRFILRK